MCSSDLSQAQGDGTPTRGGRAQGQCRQAADHRRDPAFNHGQASGRSHAAPATVVKPDPKKVPVKPKEQRLKELLQLYLTDKITPREYHQQRAKILAEP